LAYNSVSNIDLFFIDEVGKVLFVHFAPLSNLYGWHLEKMGSGGCGGGCGLWHVGGQGIKVKNDKSSIKTTVGGAIWCHFLLCKKSYKFESCKISYN
jgi:hypothetical protein